MTRFFEPINVSAAHIYHTALELSPEFSTVRMLYYDRRPTPLPRVVAGIADSLDSVIDIPRSDRPVWSPCGRFVATRAQEAVEIWDSLTAELLSTLQPSGPTPHIRIHAYSPDGRSLACSSDTGIIIWDIQTGGVAKEIQFRVSCVMSLVWSLDGRAICTTTLDQESCFIVRIFDVVLDTAQSFIIPDSQHVEHLWAHDKSFRVMRKDWRAETGLTWNLIIDIFEVGPTLTKIESFDVRLGETHWWIESFSPTTYRVSISISHQIRLLILDIRNSGRLLDETQEFDIDSHCFSPDGCFFAASQGDIAHIWKYDGSSYAAWRKLPTPDRYHKLLFSPTSSSVLGIFEDIIKVWHLDDLSLPPAPHVKQFGAFSSSGAYLVTTSNRGNTITITNVLSRTPLQLIHTGIEMYGLVLTGNVLLVVGLEVAVAWLLTEEGLVNGVFGDRIADRGDSIWTVPASEPGSEFLVEGETAVIESDDTPHIYNIRTGKALELSQTAPDWSSWRGYYLGDVTEARSHLYDGPIGDIDASPRDDWNPLRSMTKGWVKDCEGRHMLWLPVEWRVVPPNEMKWFPDVAIIQLRVSPVPSEIITIKLY